MEDFRKKERNPKQNTNKFLFPEKRDIVEDPGEDYHESQKLVGNDGKSFDELMEEKLVRQGKSWARIGEDMSARALKKLQGVAGEEGGAAEPLHGVTVCIASKLEQQLGAELGLVVRALGGRLVPSLTPAVTHFVFQGKQNDLSKEFRAAREAGAHLVCPDWVFMCREQAARLDEAMFPHTYNPKLRLDVTETRGGRVGGVKSKGKRLTKNNPNMEQDETHMEEAEASVNLMTAENADKSRETCEAAKETIAEMESLMESVNKTPASSSDRKALRTVLTTQDNVDLSAKKKASVEPDKETQVLWVDPTENEEKEKLTEKLNALESSELVPVDSLQMDTMGSMNLDDISALADKENQDDISALAGKENQAERPRLFIVSGLDGEEMKEAVARLGGQLEEGNDCNPAATHLLAGKMTRSEKMLGSLAAGIWVLDGPAYLAASLQADRWLEEHQYEWGNVEAGLSGGEQNSLQHQLAAAARRRRSTGRGAFEGMKFILLLGSSRAASFGRYLF